MTRVRKNNKRDDFFFFSKKKSTYNFLCEYTQARRVETPRLGSLAALKIEETNDVSEEYIASIFRLGE
jgi:hypothetical protein